MENNYSYLTANTRDTKEIQTKREDDALAIAHRHP